MHVLRSLLLFTAAPVALIACGGETPTTAEYDMAAREIATLAGQDDGGEHALMVRAIGIARRGMPADLHVDIDGNLAGRSGSLEMHVDVTCASRSGEPVDGCGRGTDAATYQLELAGELALLRSSARIERTARWDLTDLSGPVTRIGGESTLFLEHTTAVDDEERWNIIDASLDYDGVEVRHVDQALMAGEISYQLALARKTAEGVMRSLSVSAELVVTDDDRGVLTLDGEYDYDVQLRSGRMTASALD